MKLFAKICFALAVLLMVFLYGVRVGRYELFPFSTVQAVQTRIGTLWAGGAAAEGKKLFESLCARCHGDDGSGAEGPSLNRPHLRRAADDDALRSIIVRGIEGGAMPPVRETTVKEQNDIIAYVRTLGRKGAAKPAGDARSGEKIYFDSGCPSCHIIDGQGTAFGPELTQIGLSRGPDYLRKALIDPGSALPKGTSEVSGGFSEFLPVRVVTPDGREIRGVRLNEDTFTIQFRDMKNRLYSFAKSELREFETTPGGSLMPSYNDELTPAQVDDVVAYLSAQRIEK